MLHLPDGYSEWQSRWAELSLFGKPIMGKNAPRVDPSKVTQSAAMEPVNLLGVLLTALLLSLGAPFWYNKLKNLLRLRSMVSKKDDDQRDLRQQTQNVVTGTSGAGKGS